MSIESHRNRAHQQPSERRDTDAPGFDLDQAVFGEWGQALEFGGKVRAEVEIEASAEFGQVQFSATHERADHSATDPVFVRQVITAPDRQAPRVEGRGPVVQQAMVLDVQLAHLADRAHAKANQVEPGAGRVTLEIALQAPVGKGNGKLVVGKRKVVHADVDVACGGQLVDRDAEQRKLHFRRAEVFALDLCLRLEGLWQVRVAVGGHAVGPRRDHLLERACEARFGLPGKSVDQVDGHRPEAMAPRPGHDCQDVFLRLHPVDRILDIRVEVLDTQADPVEAQPGDRRQPCVVHGSRIDLDRVFAQGIVAQ